MKGYGHEDTWMGMQIDDLGCRIKHINNPVIHLGLQTAEQFIQKSEMALQNLLFLSKQYEKRKLSMHVKIYRHYAQLKKTGMLPVVNILYRMLQTRIHKNLRSCNPDLYLFDLYRLNHFMKIAR